MNMQQVVRSTILKGVVGSTALGTNIDIEADRDEMGICLEPMEYVLGLQHFEQYIYRDKPQGARSERGDLDLIIYSLRKFCRLAAKGNPSVLILLYLNDYMVKTQIGQSLLDIRDAFFSREAGKRFLGYLRSQKRALTGERSPRIARPDIVAKYGYDTKFAMHAVRLGWQGVEYLETKRLELPMKQASELKDIREGYCDLTDIQVTLGAIEKELTECINACAVTSADYVVIDSFLSSAYMLFWKQNKP